MADIPFRLEALRDAYRTRTLSPPDVARMALARAAAYRDPAVWIARVREDELLARASELEAMRSRIDELPLFGVPFAVKDNIDAAGFDTTAGCPAFAYRPQADAPVVARLLSAGAMLVGKTNLDQFATGLVGTRSPYGAPRCVFDSRYVSGGSSSGSAVAVASGLVAFALGTDTAGSGRIPAAYNDLVGLKPTRGLISTRGVVPACRSLDCVSIFAHDVSEAHTLLKIAQGFDSDDPYSRQDAPKSLPQMGLRIGVLAPEDREFFGDASSAALYEAAIERCAAAGAQIVTIDFAPFRDAGALLYEGAWTAERLAAIGSFMAGREDVMDPSVRTIIAAARNLTAVDAFRGQYRLAAARRAAEKEWERMDVLLIPTAPAHDTVEDVQADPIARNAKLGRYTNFVNLLDLCAIAVPAGFRNNGLPFGITFVAPVFADAALAQTANRFTSPSSASVTAPDPASQDERIPVFVVGAHLSGMPLHHELNALGAVYGGEVRTAPRYRLYALPTTPPKPGMVASSGKPAGAITGEIWRLSPDAFGRFVAKVPPPLTIGKIALEDGRSLSGFLCEAHATEAATEITKFGGWRAYRAALAESGP